MRTSVALVLVVGLIAAGARAADAPIRELRGLSPQDEVFEAASAAKPLVLRSEKDAAAYFSKDELAKLTREVDFAKQFVLVFAWHGSGGDRLSHTVAESSPEQVTFTLTRGRTRDLRPHVHLYALRANVTWTVK